MPLNPVTMQNWRRATPRRLLTRLLLVLALVTGALGLAAQENGSAQEAGQEPAAAGAASGPAMVLKFEGAVSPATSSYITRALDEAAERNLPLVVLQMDTPGGLDTSMREIIRAILASPVPVASYVSPSGARAASAGTYIMYASHVAAMAPATNLGAATPVAIGGGGGGRDDGDADDSSMPFQLQAGGDAEEAPDAVGDEGSTAQDNGDAGSDSDAPKEFTPSTASEAKVINDAVAYIRGLAELRGRNADWAESAVRRAESLSASAAAELGVIDFVATSLDDLFAQADGMVVNTPQGEITLATEGLAVEHVEPDWRTEILAVLTNPNVALILMLVGIYGLIFEFLNPGVLVPGTVGGISLIMGLYALALLPLNFAGVGLILLGLALIVAEAFAPSFGILGIGGTVALVMGAVILVDTDVEGFAVSEPLIAAVAVAGLAATLIVAKLAAGSFKARVLGGHEELIGAEAQVLDWQGGKGHVWLRGERWSARGPEGIAPDDMVRVSAVAGLVLKVERVPGELPAEPAQ